MIERLGPGSLVIIPCCASKAAGGATGLDYIDPLTHLLPDEVLRKVIAARATALSKLRQDPRFLSNHYSKNDEIVRGSDFGGQESTARYLPAIQRYKGTLYSVPGLRRAVEQSALRSGGPQILILSALYGPLHPFSPIQDYNLMMGENPARVWNEVFPLCLEALASTMKTRHVHLFTGTSTAYFRVARKAVACLFERGLIDSAIQYHVVDGSTRETPLQHGRLLHSLLIGSSADSSSIQVNRLEADAPSRRAEQFSPALTSGAVISSPQALVVKGTTSAFVPKTLRSPGTRVTTDTRSVPSSTTAGTPLRGIASPRAARFLSDIDRFHSLLSKISSARMQGLSLAELMSSGPLPERGIYFFLDEPVTPGESKQRRVCRVGTHAISTGSKATFRSRLRAHFGTMEGLGNHRGSIFRLHVGNAILQRDGRKIPSWGVGSVAPPELRMSSVLKAEEEDLERQVSRYIGSLGVLWVEVSDPSSPDSARAVIERNAIALLSNHRNPVLDAKTDWLGHHSVRDEIRSSHLWNLKHVDDDYDHTFLDAFERAVNNTIDR